MAHGYVAIVNSTYMAVAPDIKYIVSFPDFKKYGMDPFYVESLEKAFSEGKLKLSAYVKELLDQGETLPPQQFAANNLMGNVKQQDTVFLYVPIVKFPKNKKSKIKVKRETITKLIIKDKLLAQVDEQAKAFNMSRSKYISKVLKRAVKI